MKDDNVPLSEQREEKEQQFYALDSNGAITMLPLAVYAPTALHLYRTKFTDTGREPPEFQVIFDEAQYQHVIRTIRRTLSNEDVNWQVPTYVMFNIASLLPVFPNGIYNTKEKITRFVAEYPFPITSPVKLTHIRDNWPKYDEIDGQR